jgi:hypothetical protein
MLRYWVFLLSVTIGTPFKRNCHEGDGLQPVVPAVLLDHTYPF